MVFRDISSESELKVFRSANQRNKNAVEIQIPVLLLSEFKAIGRQSTVCIYIATIKLYFRLSFINILLPCSVGPCHHTMARPQVADGGTASSYGG
jgi:hypothetical protein